MSMAQSQLLTLLDQLRDFLASISSLEARLFFTAIVVITTAALMWLVSPYVVRRTRRFVAEQFITGRVERGIDQVEEYVTLRVSTIYFIRLLQLGIAFLTLVALLVVWGLTQAALGLVLLVGNLSQPILNLGISAALLAGAYVAMGALEDFIDGFTEDSDTFDQHQGEIALRVLQVTLIAMVAIMVLSLWGVNLGGLLVGAGFLGIVVGMAARQTLGAMLAGFVLMFSRPFEVGDWIEIDDREGVVSDITIVNTRLENFDGEYVVIPNDVISNSTIINRTRKGRLRVRLEVGVDYAIDPERAEEIAMDVITDLEEVMAVPRPQVVPTRFGDSAIVLELRFWIDKPSSRRRWRAKAAVIRAIYDAFDREDIKIPFPQRELSGRAETGGFQVAREPADAREPDADAREPEADAGVEPAGE